MAHSTNDSWLQCTYDESENIPHLGKTCISGELPCLKSINGNDVNITSLSSTNCNGDFLTFYNASLTNLPGSKCFNTTIKGDNITMNNASLTNLSGSTCSLLHVRNEMVHLVIYQHLIVILLVILLQKVSFLDQHQVPIVLN